MTAAQRREAEKADYDAFLAACPSRMVLDRLTDKWVVLVMVALQDEPRRYSEISRTVAGVSQKMLTQTLRTLERDGLVTRTVEASVPVTVTYELTELGRSLLAVVARLKQWAEQHIGQLTAARDAYDAQVPA